MATSAIGQAIALAGHVQLSDLDENSHEINQALAEISHIKGLLDGLLGVEAEAERRFEVALENAQARRSRLIREDERLQRLNKLSDRYLRLGLEPLGWRDANGFPKLAIFTLDAHIFKLVARRPTGIANSYRGNELEVVPHLPPKIAACYRDVIELLVDKSGTSRSSLELICQFED